MAVVEDTPNYPKVGMQMFCFNPQIANPKISGCIPLLQIRKLLRWASLQMANSPQIA
jgi:hypothetical protein